MREFKAYTATIDYREATAVLVDSETARTPAIIDWCILYRTAGEQIRRQTGMEPEAFLDGMRELMAPA